MSNLSASFDGIERGKCMNFAKKNQKLGALSKTIRQLNVVLSSFQTKCDGLSEQKDLWIN